MIGITALIGSAFLSTLSLRRATLLPMFDDISDDISIHALLAESDKSRHRASTGLCDISIHALLAESDDNLTQGVFNLFTFLSTLSLRRATKACKIRDNKLEISIHALLAESDTPSKRLERRYRHFYPRSPCGERRR